MEQKEIRILAIDDMAENVMVLKALLLDSFPEALIFEALSGDQGLEIAANVNPDVILLDIDMPKMNGFETCQKLKADSELKDIPIVLIDAGKSDKERRIKGLEVGGEVLLSRPIDAAELIAQVQAMIKLKAINDKKKQTNLKLSKLVAERTKDLELTHLATLNILEDLKQENENRRKTEEALRESESKLKRAELVSKSGNWELDIENGIYTLSEGALHILGCNNFQVSLSEIESLLLPEYHEIISSRNKKIIEKGGSRRIEYKIYNSQKKEILDIESIAFLNREKGLIYGVLRDITEQKQTELQVIQLSQAIEQSLSSIVITNLSGEIEYVNKAFTKITGYTKQEALGKNPRILKTDLMSQEEYQQLWSTILSGNEWKGEFYNRKKNGEYYWESATISPIKNAVGKTTHFLAIKEDITLRKNAEDALRKSEMFLRTFINNTPFEIWARDLDNICILENKVLSDHIGSIIGQKINEVVEIETEISKQWLYNNQLLEKGDIIDDEIEITINEDFKNFREICFPLVLDEKVIGVAGFNIDITELKTIEKSLRESQGQLKQFANHLQNIREEERILLAREIHDDLGQILVAVKMDLGFLGKTAPRFIKEEVAEDFMKQFQRLADLVDNALQSARRIMTNLRPAALDMLGFIDAIKAHLKSFEERNNIKYIFDTKYDKLDLDPQCALALFRIMQESLNNVVKHAMASQVIIHLEITPENNLIFEIRDNGKGFDTTMKKRTDSYGLIGMKERTYILEGDINISSTPNVGTCVSVQLPYKESPKTS